MGYCTHESRLVLRSAEIQPLIPRFVRFSLFDLNRLEFKSAPPQTQTTPTKTTLTLLLYSGNKTIAQYYYLIVWQSGALIRPYPLLETVAVRSFFLHLFCRSGCKTKHSCA
jgi:hypothetical protein